MDTAIKSLNTISFCSGIRGLERGAERVIGPTRTIAYVEIEAFIIENLLQGMEKGLLDPAPIWPNIKTFPVGGFHGKIHGIFGGYPCKPFSIIGKQNGEEHPEHLWPHLFKHFGAIRPVFGFFENVANHLHIGYRQVRSDLQGIGYTVKEGIYSALEAGATHTRERLFILAMDYSQCQRLQGYFWDGIGKEGWEIEDRPISKTSIFPRERGLSQWEWEQPRTLNIKSGMGCTVNGYNFREDLLRAYGNSVVEQTAEIAFIDLLNKHKCQLPY